MLQKTAILTLSFLLACAYAQNTPYYSDRGYPQNEPETHIVKKGETLYAISKRYGMSVKEIMRMNRLRNSVIKIGQRLEVEAGSSNKRFTNRSQNDDMGLDSGAQRVEGSRTFYKVQNGDNIYSIASAFGVLVDEIREWNGISNVQAGQTLIVGKNDVARIPAYRPAPPSRDTYENDANLYRRQSYRTSSAGSNSRTQRQASNDRYEDYRQDSQPRENNFYKRREASSSERDNFNSRRTAVNYAADYPRRGRQSEAARYTEKYNNEVIQDNFSNYDKDYSDNYASASQAKSSYNDYESRIRNSRMPRAADIKYGSRAEVLYEYVGETDQAQAPLNQSSRTHARTVNPRENREKQLGNLTGDFTELRSKKALNNRFYAFHNSLPIGSKVKMMIPENEGYVEVEIIDRLPSYERVMIGLSPACTAILEGAGNPHVVTIRK